MNTLPYKQTLKRAAFLVLTPFLCTGCATLDSLAALDSAMAQSLANTTGSTAAVTEEAAVEAATGYATEAAAAPARGGRIPPGYRRVGYNPPGPRGGPGAGAPYYNPPGPRGGYVAPAKRRAVVVNPPGPAPTRVVRTAPVRRVAR